MRRVVAAATLTLVGAAVLPGQGAGAALPIGAVHAKVKPECSGTIRLYRQNPASSGTVNNSYFTLQGGQTMAWQKAYGSQGYWATVQAFSATELGWRYARRDCIKEYTP